MRYSLSYKRKFNITIGNNTIPITQNVIATIGNCSTSISDTSWRTLLNSYIGEIKNCDLSDATIVWDTTHASEVYYNFIKADDNSDERLVNSTSYACELNVVSKKYNSQSGTHPKFLNFKTQYSSGSFASSLLAEIKGMIDSSASYNSAKEYVVISLVIDIK